MRRRLWMAILLAGSPSPVLAHAHLSDSKPAADSTVAKPTEVSLQFTEALERPFSTVEVRDAAGRRVDDGTLRPSTDALHLILGLPALQPGIYKVTWHATSVDTHRTEGSFRFTVAP
jgi:methionine-rich copper-binding protein CopC